MAFGGFTDRPRAAPIADINMTPLIDVMLVLLVIFIIAAPLLTHAIGLELPRADAPAPPPAQAAGVTVSIDAGGTFYWNDEAIDLAALQARLSAAAHGAAPPDIALRADQSTPYRTIAAVMAAAQQAGVAHLGFVVTPPDGGAGSAGGAAARQH